MDTKTTYRAIYLIPADADEATVNTIVALNDEETGPGPQTLGQIIDTCQQNECTADLLDETGARKGWVRDGGNYTLT